MENNKIFASRRFIETADIIKKNINNSSKIIEIGANDASFKEFLNQLSNENWVTVDKFGNPDIKSDIDGKNAHLPFADNSIDVVICTEVLEHLIQGSYLVKEINRVLKNDALAIISVPNIVSFKSRVKVILGLLPPSAASGDCGHPLGGTGYLIDNSWVGGHVVDFNKDRFFGYLERGGLKVKQHVKLPLEISYKNSFIFYVPKFLSPKQLSDFILVLASKK